MKNVYLLLIVFCQQIWSQNSNSSLLSFTLERDAEFSNFFENPVSISPVYNTNVKIDGKLFFQEVYGKIVLKPTQNNRIVIVPPPSSSTIRQKMYSVAITDPNDTIVNPQTIISKIRRGNSQTNEGTGDGVTLSVGPVPFTNELSLGLNLDTAYLIRYKIYNAYGIVEKEFIFPNQSTNSYVIDVSSLRSLSMYTLEVAFFGRYSNYIVRRTIIKN